MNQRREWLFITLTMWLLATSGAWTAGSLWQEYGFCWRKFFEMPLGPALIIGFLILASLLFIGIGFGGLMWATEEEPNDQEEA